MSDESPVHALPGGRVVAMVAGREVSTRVRSKAFLISNAIILTLIGGGLIVTSVLQDHIGKPPKIGLVGTAQSLSSSVTGAGEALGTKVRIQKVTDEKTGRALVADGKLKVALVPMKGAFIAVTEKSLSPAVQGVLTTAVRQQAASKALTARGINPTDFALAISQASITVEAVKPPKKDAVERTALAFAAVGLLYMQLLGNGIAVATGVVEEKTSRVVELLLSTIKPLHLLVGKIVGIGIVGLVQLAAYAVVGLGIGSATGLISVSSAAVAVFAGTLGWYVLGFAFLGVLYAAAGSLVSRQEEVGSATGPLSIIVISMFAIAQACVQNPDGTMASIMSWIPPYSAVLMPLRIAAGVTSTVQVVGTVILMLITSSALAVVSAKVYQRSILRTGSRVSWKQAFGRG